MDKRRALLFLTLLTIGCILIFLGIFFKDKKDVPQYDVFERIWHSPCIKFEKFSDDGTQYEPIIITSETLNLRNFFCSLRIVEGDTPIGDVLYKITFNCKEIMLNDEEIIILVGKQALSIDGVIYVPENGVLYKDIKDAIHGKWKYFDAPR